ncbi:uncharacterized protein MCYG_01577 [Microsporum canis CBS 113480]|uniref:Uncharacterized protein n=1 Tax=Arthroderma otae (strain ATCC MYA-4605 / CBS 113480) TaxID=554155 RepID=C5FHL8_ARTOC|nr:uncharacterized protein MCYG_01577 [Microsporum canis CBS 113480]EEQ28758.1 predicted protein [Microsporum canis CBS 113480]
MYSFSFTWPSRCGDKVGSPLISWSGGRGISIPRGIATVIHLGSKALTPGESGIRNENGKRKSAEEAVAPYSHIHNAWLINDYPYKVQVEDRKERRELNSHRNSCFRLSKEGNDPSKYKGRAS